jgi:hypothetical protein
MAPEGVADTMQRVRQEQGHGEYWKAVENREDRWVVACGGSETPFLYDRTPWLYVFNPARHEHGYLNLLTDVVHPDYRSESC